MRRWTTFAAAVSFGVAIGAARPGSQEGAALPAPGFHHLHLNTVASGAAVDFYPKQFATTARSTFGGAPALKAGNVWLLFNQVKRPPSSSPQSAYWHFGWHVRDSRKSFDLYEKQHTKILPLFTSNEGGTVSFSSDAPLWPGNRTRTEITEDRKKNLTPKRGAGYVYIEGPDGVAIEVLGDMQVERFNHVHMYQDDAFCAERWYQVHLNAPLSSGRRVGQPPPDAPCKVPTGEPTWLSLEKQGTVRAPAAGVVFDDVEMNWYQWPGERPLASSEGQAIDHVGLSVNRLDAWLAKLKGEGVKIVKQPYRFADTRAFLIEGPSHERIELVEKP